MPEFNSEIDVGNIALQLCGVSQMDTTLGYSDPAVKKNAQAVQSVYGKMRQAELERSYWKFAIKRAVLRPIDSTFMLLAPALWSASTVYFNGSVVTDSSGTIWQSYQPDNLNQQPGQGPGWKLYFGPMAIPPWTATAYLAGEVVYVPGVSGAYSVYLSLTSANSDNPATSTAYDPTVTYPRDAIVTFSAVTYQSLIDLNLNNEPDLAPALWAVGTTYAAGAKVGGSDGAIYQSVGSGNIGHDPTTDGGTHWTNTGVLNPWTTVITRGTGSTNWLLLGCALTEFAPQYPLGAGPSSNVVSRNAYRLPANYLRKADQNPKLPVAALGGPTGIADSDWQFEDDYFVSACSDVIVFRFVADFADVKRMHAMFCYGVGARIALQVCTTVTQSSAKLADIGKAYARFMGEARLVDAIEDDWGQEPDDEYIAVRF